jgi:hypothetical protein
MVWLPDNVKSRELSQEDLMTTIIFHNYLSYNSKINPFGLVLLVLMLHHDPTGTSKHNMIIPLFFYLYTLKFKIITNM